MKLVDFSLPTLVTFGLDALNELGAVAKKYGSRALVIADYDALTDAGIIDRATEILKKSAINYTVYGDINSKSDTADADLAAGMARYGKADVIVALGGWHVQNLSKAAATVVTNGGEASDYLLNEEKSAKDFLARQILHNAPMPVIAVPTIAGTLSEIGSGYTARDKYDRMNKEFFSPKIYAKECIVDPMLHMTVPQKYLIISAMSIFATSFEIYITRYNNIIAESLALRAMEMVYQNLKSVVEQQTNKDLRLNIAMASLLAGIAANTSKTGALHAIALAANSYADTYPGVAMTVLLPHVIDYNVTAGGQKYVGLLRAFGEDTSGMSVIEAAIGSAETVRRFIASFNIPSRLSEIDLKPEAFDAIAENALTFEGMEYLPRPMKKGDIITLLEQAQ